MTKDSEPSMDLKELDHQTDVEISKKLGWVLQEHHQENLFQKIAGFLGFGHHHHSGISNVFCLHELLNLNISCV